MQVLIADDEATTRKMLERTLAKWDYQVVVCTDGDQAWEALHCEERPRLVILDWLMPGLSGLDLCRRIRAQKREDYVYVLLLTSKTEREDIIAGIDAGADDYLTKPFETRELKVRLRTGKRILGLQAKLLEEIRAKDAAMSALERSNEELRNFAYLASHDLHEPLRMVASYVDLLARRYRGRLDADADEFIQFAVEGVERSRRIIRGLLSYAKVGATGNKFANVSMEDALRDARFNLELLINESGAEISSDPLPAVVGDQTQLGQLFQNLIANAVYYRSESTPKVHVAVCQADGCWQFSIRDNGIGIADEALETIFELFGRLNADVHPDGTGMGLAICRKIVERHGGSLWAESEPGEGSTFHFTLPVSS